LFIRFYDNNNTGLLLGQIESFKTYGTNLFIKIRTESGVDVARLEYDNMENMLSDVDGLETVLNEYYQLAMGLEQANQMGFGTDVQGYEDGSENEMDCEEDRMGFV
jgi:hypothetical protein